jgi:hypothetical protein
VKEQPQAQAPAPDAKALEELNAFMATLAGC